MKYEHLNPNHCRPPGSFSTFLRHPNPKKNTAIEKAIFKEHRFAFCYWFKWNKELADKGRINKPATLVTIDWHNDLLPPGEAEKRDLSELDQPQFSEIGFFAWARLNGNNDGHILSAAYLNFIGDIIVLSKQAREKNSEFQDIFGNIHRIAVFTSFDRFTAHLIKSNYESVFFDLDLDYFVKKQGLLYETKGWSLIPKQEMKSIVDPDNEFFLWLFSLMDGFTIATEPEHCGGILNSIQLLKMVEERLFNHDQTWKHHAKS